MPLICRNCGAVNPDGSAACGDCRAEHFLVPAGLLVTPVPASPSSVHLDLCRNCGHELPAVITEHCPNCRIARTPQNGPDQEKAGKLGRLFPGKKMLFN